MQSSSMYHVTVMALHSHIKYSFPVSYQEICFFLSHTETNNVIFVLLDAGHLYVRLFLCFGNTIDLRFKARTLWNMDSIVKYNLHRNM